VLDDRVLEVLSRLEREDEEERERGLPAMQRSRAVAPTTGRFLFSLVAPHADCEVLEIGGSKGYSSIWLGAGVRHLGGHVLSLEHDPAKVEAWRRNVRDAGLDEWVELREGDAFEALPAIDDVFDLVFLDAEKDDYENLFALARTKLEPGALVVAQWRRRKARAVGEPRVVCHQGVQLPGSRNTHRGCQVDGVERRNRWGRQGLGGGEEIRVERD